MVLYFDIFHHPLSLGEIERLVAPGQPARVLAAVARLAAEGRVEWEGRFCFAHGQRRGIARREQRARCAERAWPWAKRAAAILARLPFVEGVLVTGSLSKNSTDPNADIDFMLLVRPGRVWTLKAMLQGSRRLLPLAGRELFCTNYLLAIDRPLIDDRNIFTAIELATAVPMAGREACVAMLEANTWARSFVPGFDWSIRRAGHTPLVPSRSLARGVESMWVEPVGRAVEHASLELFDRYWNRKYGWLEARDRAQRFKRREELATNHLHDFQEYVLRELRLRMAAAGIDESLGFEGP